eukprot:6214225-Pleurochrysis_carterae.AAC.3
MPPVEHCGADAPAVDLHPVQTAEGDLLACCAFETKCGRLKGVDERRLCERNRLDRVFAESSIRLVGPPGQSAAGKHEVAHVPAANRLR